MPRGGEARSRSAKRACRDTTWTTHRVGRAQQRLDREEDGADLEGGGPAVLEDVEADAAELVDVGVVDLGQEADLGRRHRVLFREEELELELAACSGENMSAHLFGIHMHSPEGGCKTP